MPKSLHKNLSSAHRARDTCTVTMLQRETPEFISPEMWPPNSPDLNPVDYSICRPMGYASREGLPLVDPWCELKERWKNVESWKNVCWGSGGCWTMHTVIAAAIAQWHSHLNACVCVNGGHFENKFWASDFLLCFVCFVDTGCRKCDRYKHVQSANIVCNVLLLCLRLSHGIVTT